MLVTKTYEPLRPLRCPDAPTAAYAESLGSGRVFYGESHWPSRSYSLVKFTPADLEGR
jgi:hypothetical protein